AGQHAGHGVRRSEEEPLGRARLAREVDRGGLIEGEVGADRDAALLRPRLAREQNGGGAVGEGGAVARREGALAALLVEGGLQRRELLERSVGAQAVVPREATEGRDEVVEEAGVVGAGEVLLRGERQSVLVGALDLPLLGRDLRVV